MKNASLVLLLLAGTLSVSAKPPKDGRGTRIFDARLRQASN
jgi:hypothetical protein